MQEMAMRRTLNTISQSFSLTGEGIDTISELMEKELKQFGMEVQNRIRIRFSFEESLLRLRDRFGESAVVTFSMGQRLGKPFLQIVHEGEQYNPLNKRAVDLEDWSGSLLTAVGLFPQYNYSKGRNILRIILPARHMHPALKMVIAIIVGIFAGGISLALFSDTQQTALMDVLLQPIYDLWIRILSGISGAIIFFMATTTVLNAGTIGEEGGNTRTITMRYFGISLYMAAFTILLCYAFGKDTLSIGRIKGEEVLRSIDQLFHLVPDNIFTSIAGANTPQILLLAFVLGYGLVALGSRVKDLVSIIRQINMFGLLLADWVSRSVPYFTAALIWYEILWHETELLRAIWMIMMFSLAISVAFIGVTIVVVALLKEVSIGILIKKGWITFKTAIRSGGMDEGYGELEHSCIDKFGIERHFAEVSIPHGLVMCMPINVIGTLCLTIAAAARYDVAVTGYWLVVAGLLSVVLFVATPPVPGANLLAYIMIFDFLGIPQIVLIDAMIFEVLFGIFAGAGNQTVLQMELIQHADRIGLLDKERLRKR